MIADALSSDVQETVNFGQFRSLAQELEKFVQGHAQCRTGVESRMLAEMGFHGVG